MKAHITDPLIRAYCEKYSSTLPQTFEAMATKAEETGRSEMLSGPYLGLFLTMFAKLLRPTNVLELGTFTGYGTLCLLEGLPEDSIIHTVENCVDLHPMSSTAIADHPRAAQVTQHTADAATVIDELDLTWDLVFIDASKRQYIEYYDAVFPRVRKGGVILADNVLWKGRLVSKDNDKIGMRLDEFNQYVHADSRVTNMILPVDDGMNLIIKS